MSVGQRRDGADPPTMQYGEKSRLERNPVVTATEVVREERDRISARRKAAGLSLGIPKIDAKGLALSGGGIRSATFNLGLLQAMEHCGAFRHVDYQSTVSGGGYIGSSLTWFMSRRDEFPFGRAPEPGSRDDADGVSLASRSVRWLRLHGEYLVPGQGLDYWALGAAWLRGFVLNLVVFVPLLLLVAVVLSQELPEALVRLVDWLPALTHEGHPTRNYFYLILALGFVVLALLIVSFLVSGVLSSGRFQRALGLRATSTRWSGLMLRWAVVLVVLGSVPLVAEQIEELFGHESGESAVTSPEAPAPVAPAAEETWHLGEQLTLLPVALIGVALIVFGWRGRAVEAGAKKTRGGYLTVGLMLLLFFLLLSLYHLASLWEVEPGTHQHLLDRLEPFLPYIVSGAIVLLLIVLLANVNNLSMHRFYRNRLRQAFMPSFQDEGEGVDHADEHASDDYRLADIQPSRAPYHLINANLLTLTSNDRRLRARGGDSFVFSPKFCGSESTGYARTESYVGGSVDLATAMAISGAAVQSNTEATRSRPLAILMSLLNIRLGYWIANPNRTWWWKGPLGRIYWLSYFYVMLEMVGRVNERRHYVHLSDGGHFENLGLYELVRRRCQYIVVCDVAADPEFRFSDLARACQLVRVDFGAEVRINTQPLVPQDRSSTDAGLLFSRQPAVIGEVEYRDGTKGKIIYIKPCLIKGLPEDVYGYRRINSRFPNESTADQFFSERQFEAYRELGFQIGKWVFGRPERPEDVEKLLERHETPDRAALDQYLRSWRESGKRSPEEGWSLEQVCAMVVLKTAASAVTGPADRFGAGDGGVT